MTYETVSLNEREREGIKREFLRQDALVPLLSCPDLGSKVVSLGLAREIGTVNDEIARFLFDAGGEPIARESLRGSFVVWRGKFGIKIESDSSRTMEVRIKGFKDFVHPTLSANPDGTFHSLFLFPEIIARICAMRGVELVLPRSWAMNSVFGGFDPAKAYYQTNFWELENNDTLAFAYLLEAKRLAFLGTHDLAAHLAGLNAEAWNKLPAIARNTREAVEDYLRDTGRDVSIAALVLPYSAGVVLDDLAQPPSYGSASHLQMLDLLIDTLKRGLPRGLVSAILLKFPASFENLIQASREKGVTAAHATETLNEFLAELNASTGQ